MKLKQFFGWLLILALLGGAGYAGWWFMVRPKPIAITVMKVERGRVEQTVTAMSAGTVMAPVDSMLAAGYMGVVSVVPFKEGDHVNEGDIVCEFAHGDLDAQVALAEANLKVGETRLAQARLSATISDETSATRVSQVQAERDLARLEYDRVKSLVEKKVASQSEFDRMAAALRVATEGLAAAQTARKEVQVRQEEVRSTEQMLVQLREAITAAKEVRDKAIVRAPFSGVIGRLNVDPGEGTAIGMPLMQLVKDGPRYVKAPFDEANAAEIKVGQTARVNVDTFRGTDFPGVVEYIAPVVATNLDLTRTVEVHVRIEVDEGKFMPGMSADVTVISDAKDGVLNVPTESLIREEYAFVMKTSATGSIKAERRPVKCGIGNWNTREVTEGIEEGEMIIKSVGVKGLKDGVSVRIVEELDDI
jgi:HlyD family secretion protein